jgi:3-isopropylmalate/(R)-2-methylmalate dehydratase large subunit
MGMTIVEKVMARAADLPQVHPGQYVDARIDRVIAHEEFYRIHTAAEEAGIPGGLPDIWDRDRFHVMLEHFQPALNVTQSVRQQKMREVAKQYGLTHFRDALCGVIHRVAIEDYVLPGELALGSDSHSVAWGAINCVGTGMGEHELAYALVYGTLWFKVPETIRVRLEGQLHPALSGKDVALYLAGQYTTTFALYKAVEFTGPGASAMSIDARISLAAHAVELGGKFGLFEYDDKTARFLQDRTVMTHQKGWARPVVPDPDANYCQEVRITVSTTWYPSVARPEPRSTRHRSGPAPTGIWTTSPPWSESSRGSESLLGCASSSNRTPGRCTGPAWIAVSFHTCWTPGSRYCRQDATCVWGCRERSRRGMSASPPPPETSGAAWEVARP